MDLEQRLKEYLVVGPGRACVEAPGVQELLRVVRGRVVHGRTAADLERAGFRRELEDEARRYLDEESESNFSHLMLSPEDKVELFERLMCSMFGLGPLEELLQQPDLTEIMVNGPSHVFVEQGNRITRATDSKDRPIRFVDEQELRYVIDKIVAPINKKVDDAEPIVDARLPDGARVGVVLHPVPGAAGDAPGITKRRRMTHGRGCREHKER